MFGLFEYESIGDVHWIDSQLDGLHSILHGIATANNIACKRPPMLKNVITVADVACASLCFRVKEIKSLTSNFVQIHDLKCESNWVQKSHCGLGAPGFCDGGVGALLSWLFESTEANSPLLRLLLCCLEAVEIEKRIPFNGLFQDAFWV